jgi:hypothetical protein
MDIKFRKYNYYFDDDKTQPQKERIEVFVNGEELIFGEDVAAIYIDQCKYHGETVFIHGYSEGGFVNMTICLECCNMIYEKILKDGKIDA